MVPEWLAQVLGDHVSGAGKEKRIDKFVAMAGRLLPSVWHSI